MPLWQRVRPHVARCAYLPNLTSPWPAPFADALDWVRAQEHPDTLLSLSSLATTLFLQGRHEEAEPLMRRALEARERVLGATHPRTTAAARNLSVVLESLGRSEEASALLHVY